MSIQEKVPVVTNTIAITEINGVMVAGANGPIHVPNSGMFTVKGQVGAMELLPLPDVYLYVIAQTGNLTLVGSGPPDPIDNKYEIEANLMGCVPGNQIVVLLALWGDRGANLAQAGAEIQADL